MRIDGNGNSPYCDASGCILEADSRFYGTFPAGVLIPWTLAFWTVFYGNFQTIVSIRVLRFWRLEHQHSHNNIRTQEKIHRFSTGYSWRHYFYELLFIRLGRQIVGVCILRFKLDWHSFRSVIWLPDNRDLNSHSHRYFTCVLDFIGQQFRWNWTSSLDPSLWDLLFFHFYRQYSWCYANIHR